MNDIRNRFNHLSDNEREHICDLPTYFAKAGRMKSLQDLLTDFEFMEVKTSILGTQSLIDDYELSDDGILRLIQSALRREAHVLATDPKLLWQQLYNRLQEEEGVSTRLFQDELERRNRPEAKPWVRLMEPIGIEDSSLVCVFAGHTDMVSSVAFSPDGRLVLTGSFDGTARLWKLRSGSELRQLQGHTDRVNSVAFSPDGQLVLTGSSDGTARLWNVESGRELWQLQGHTDKVNSVAFSSDGQLVLTGSSDGTARLWNVESGRELWQLQGRLSTRNDLVLRLTRQTMSGVHSVAFSPDGQLVLTGSADGTVRLCEVEDRHELMWLQVTDRDIHCVAFSPDGRLMLIGSRDTAAHLLEVSSGSELRQLQDHRGEVWGVSFSPDGQLALTGSSDGTVYLCNVSSGGSELRQLQGHTNGVSSVTFSPDGQLALTGSSDGTVRLWELRSRYEQQQEGHTEGVNSVTFSPDGRLVLTGSSDGTARLWEVSSRREYRRFEGLHDYILKRDAGQFWNSGSKTVNSVTFSPDGKLVLTGSADGIVRLWEIESGREYRQFRTDNMVLSVAFSPDGALVLAFSSRDGTTRDGTIYTWKVSSGRELRQQPNPARTLVTAVCRIICKKITLISKFFRPESRPYEGPRFVVTSTAHGHYQDPGGDTIPIFVEWQKREDVKARSGLTSGFSALHLSTTFEMVSQQGYMNKASNVMFSPNDRLAITRDNKGRVYFRQAQGPEHEKLLGIYVATYEPGALYWHDATHLTLVDKCGPEGFPHFYHLALEGKWE